jgi:hypothetical protein
MFIRVDQARNGISPATRGDLDAKIMSLLWLELC